MYWCLVCLLSCILHYTPLFVITLFQTRNLKCRIQFVLCSEVPSSICHFDQINREVGSVILMYPLRTCIEYIFLLEYNWNLICHFVSWVPFLSITLEWKYCPQLMQRFLDERMIGCCPQLKWLFYLYTGEQIMYVLFCYFATKLYGAADK